MELDELRPLTILVHGDWGSGKSWLAQTAPAPRLVLDAEGGSEFTYGRKVDWDNVNEAPPPMKRAETCVLHVSSLKVLQGAFQWLRKGRHPFESVILDSLSEMQKRIVDDIAGVEQMEIQDWGSLFRKGESLVRAFRDLKYNPVKPMKCVVYVTGSVEKGPEKKTKERPYVQGQLGATLPGFVDIVGRLAAETIEGEARRLLWVQPLGDYIAKDRTHTFKKGFVDVTFDEEDGWENNLETMMEKITATLAKRAGGERDGGEPAAKKKAARRRGEED
jgi:hypothetical protein